MKSLCRGGCSVPKSIGLISSALFSFLIVQTSAGSEPPTLSTPGPQTIYPGETISGIDFFIDDPDTPLESLTITVHSTNQEVVPDSHLTVTGVAPNKALTIQTSPDHRGTTTIHIRVSDDTENVAEEFFDLEVRELVLTSRVIHPHPAFAGSWGDFNGNGNLDLAIGVHEPSAYKTVILEQAASGMSFSPLWPRNLRAIDTVYAWGNLENDSSLDLIETGDLELTHLYRAQQESLLMPVLGGLPQLSRSHAIWFDFDNDGDQDLFLSGVSDADWPNTRYDVLLIPNSGGVLAGSTPLPVTGHPTAVDVGDFDNDGDLDLLICLNNLFTTEGETRILRNDGEGQFTPIEGPFAAGPLGRWVDLNNDGWLDIVLAGYGHLTIHANEGGSGFAPATLHSAGNVREMADGDPDLDGDLDLLIMVDMEDPPYQRVGLLRNDRNFTLTPLGYDYAASLPRGIEWTDLDKNGVPDILLSTTAGLVLFSSTSRSTNTPPQPPSNLRATVAENNRVELHWDPAFDAETPSAALDYNLRVESESGTSVVLSPNLDASSQHLLRPRHHNAGKATFWVLNDVPPGDYHWTVQAIDTAGVTSPFASESTFNILNARPVISLIPDQSTTVNQTLEAIPFSVSDEETPPGDLQIVLSTSNPTLLPEANLIVSGSGTDRTLRIIPSPNTTGRASITLTAQDDYGHSRDVEFQVTVNLFTITEELSQPEHVHNILWADLHADERLELVTPSTAYFLNLDGTLTGNSTTISGTGSHSIDLGDFDRDGDLDPSLNGHWVRRTVQSGGGIEFEEVFSSPLPLDTQRWADLDNDGDLDLIVPGKIYINEEDGSFTLLDVFGMSGANLDIGDYDADGDLDILAIAGLAPPLTAIWRNDGNLKFTELGRDWLPQLSDGTGAWGDFNNDGRLDLLLSGSTSYFGAEGFSVILEQLEDGTFIEFPAHIAPLTTSSAAWGDYDNDGWLDVFTCGFHEGKPFAALYRNQGGEAFDTVDAFIPPAPHRAVAWGDFDRDGDLDLYVGGRRREHVESSPRGAILRNEINPSPSLPPPPENLHVIIETNTQNDVTFSWDPGQTASDPVNRGVGFELRVGTTPGGHEIMTAHSDAASGRRAVSGMATIHGRSQWTLFDLKGGTYYWSVQSVSQSFAGSPFAPEGTFTLPNRPPTISRLPHQAAPIGQVISNIPFTVWDRESRDQLTLSAVSSNPELIDTGDIVIEGSGTNRTLSLHPKLDQTGRAAITVTVTDPDGGISDVRFLLGVEEFTLDSESFPQLLAATGDWGDYDNDGHLDLILSGELHGACITTLHRGQGDGTFSDSGIQIPQLKTAVLRWVDLNRDGWLDLVLNGTGPDNLPHTHVLLNMEGSNFQEIAHPFPNTTSTSFDVGDFDGDGDIDLVWSGTRRPQSAFPLPVDETFIFEQVSESELLFFRNPTILPQISEGNVSWVDIDSDGDLDLFLSGSLYERGLPREPLVRIYLNDGHGQFSQAPILLPPLPTPRAAWHDMNEDGFPDLAFAGGGELVIYQNEAGSDLVERWRFEHTIDWPHVAWGDYDNDGLSDLVVTGYWLDRYRTTLFVNSRETWPWLPMPLIDANDSHGFALWGDSDNDLDLDLLLTARGKGVVSLYRNNSTTPNTPPSQPALTESHVQGNRATLSWSPSPDAQTATSALTYNLRVGTAPGRSDLVSPHADSENGFRRVARPGNLSHNTTVTLRHLPAGTYHWNVQAVDPTLAGSSFALESSFTVAAALPSIQPIPDQFTLANHPTQTITVTLSDPDTEPAALSVQAFSDDPSLIPANGFDWSGDGFDRSLVVTPAPGRTGSARILLRVADSEAGYTQTSFTITVGLFTDIQAEIEGTSPTVVRWADIDQDGDLDLLLAGTFFDFLHTALIHRQTTPGVFECVQDLGPMEARSADWGDFDHDGDLDLLIGSRNASFVYENDGHGTLSRLELPLPGLASSGTALWMDADGDGDLDVFLSGGSQTSIFLNHRGTFIDAKVQLPRLGAAVAAWGDFDNNGDLDLVLAGAGLWSILTRLYHHEEGLRYVDSGIPLPRIRSGVLDWGDYDHDGKLDLLIAGQGLVAPVTRVLRGVDQGSFANSGIVLPELQYPVGKWMDYDGDGDLDVLLVGQGESARVADIYENQGNGVFMAADVVLPRLLYGGIAEGDYDGDGDLDLIIGGTDLDGRRRTMILQNHSQNPNTAPGAPDGLAASIITPNSVHLTWNVPTDDHSNGPGSLSYNLLVGTSPDAVDVVSPGASLSTGYHRLAKSGNAGFTPFHTLKNLPNGAYYWRVQAIDSAFLGSVFSEPAMFVISNDLPTLATLGNRSFALNTGPHSIPLSGILPGSMAPASLSVLAWSDHPDLLPDPAVSYSPPSATGSLTLTPVLDLPGTARIFVAVTGSSDSDPPITLASTNAFDVTIGAVPTAINIEVTTFEDTPVNIPLQGADADSKEFHFLVQSNPLHGQLEGDFPELVYHPHPDYYGPDTFVFSAYDGFFDSSHAIVTLTVISVRDVDHTLVSLAQIEEGRIRIGLTGEPLGSYVIERSTDLETWGTISNVKANTDGVLQFIDVSPPGHSAFYRAQLLE